jgi:hypothetical protein
VEKFRFDIHALRHGSGGGTRAKPVSHTRSPITGGSAGSNAGSGGGFVAALTAGGVKEKDIAVLLENEVEDFDTLSAFEKTDILDLGIKAGSAMKILRVCAANV